MLEAATRIYVTDPNREDNLIPAVVSETLGEKVIVRFLQPITLTPGAETELRYHNQHNCFTRVPCQLQRMFSSGQYPTGALVLTGDEEVAENRSSFRVTVADDIVQATISGDTQADVVNISAGGIGAVVDIDDYKLGDWIKIALQYDCGEHTGRMQVRSVWAQDDGRFRYGLMADPDEADLVSQLSRITQQLQQVKARRASRIGTNNRAGAAVAEDTATPAETKPSNQDQQTGEQTPESDELCQDGTQRQHQRNRWPGMAKVYIREEHNLRVLDVETGDLSRGGISFVCPQYIYKDSEILFEKPISGGFFRVVATVCNIMVREKGTHRIGAKFVGAPLKPGEIPKAYDPGQYAA
ncbi:MAG: PilZ domain-containing protein [Phycisphaeraceae bacterium]